MKSSLLASTTASTGCHSVSTSRSAHSRGETPLSSAAVSTFCPCSSVPVRNQVGCCRCRCQRAIMSAATVVYALPMEGGAVT
jgi:hypothetical protein